MTSNTGRIESDMRDWLCKAEVIAKLGESGADEMIQYLETHCADKCRDHPDAPGVKVGFLTTIQL